MQTRRLPTLAALGTALVALPGTALAQNSAALTTAVDFADTKTQLYSVGAILIGVAVVLMAIRFVRKLVH